MSIPDEGDLGAVPDKILDLAGGEAISPVWLNDLGGVTYRLGDGVAARYVKWAPLNAESSLADEAVRMEWARHFTRVPLVLSHGTLDVHEWLETGAIVGESAVTPRWLDEPEAAVRAVGAGLRALHDALPVAECDWMWDVPTRIAHATGRGIDVPPALHDEPPIDRLVVCHGDACVPNTILSPDGAVAGHVDLARLGVADRWADIAVASMSTVWNYGDGYDDLLIEAYGLTPDRERFSYYRDLWNAT